MTDGCPIPTGKTLMTSVLGRPMDLHNQRSEAWSGLYDNASPPRATLRDAGCGIFALAHCAQFVSGARVDVDELAAFSMRSGGRGDDGTDRPALLKAMAITGRLDALGFEYHGEGHVNDPDRLFGFLSRGQGAALGNLRVGHIVALCAARSVEGEAQVLALDSYSETFHDLVRPHVRGCEPGTLCTYAVQNERGMVTGCSMGFMAYWVPASITRDVNYLCSIRGARS